MMVKKVTGAAGEYFCFFHTTSASLPDVQFFHCTSASLPEHRFRNNPCGHGRTGPPINQIAVRKAEPQLEVMYRTLTASLFREQ